MKEINFPIFKTKTDNLTGKFNLNDPEERKMYFVVKAGPEIEKIREYLKSNTFVAYLLGKKNSGKGTYSKLFMEAIGSDNIGHISIGDIIRDIHAALSSEEEETALINFLKKNYRGFHNLDEIIGAIKNRSQSALIPTELVIALLKYEINKRPKQAIFIDGFPRGLDQINYSLFLKELLGYREDPDFFIFINLPETIIDERIKFRVVCPICKTPRNLKLLATKEVGYDEQKNNFYLICDNFSCNKARMVPKEGDELGIEPIRARLEIDDQIFKRLLKLQGVPMVYLRNSLPVVNAGDFVDKYELTPEYGYELDDVSGKVKIIEKPWTINDDEGVSSYSLLPAAVVVGMIKQIVKVLNL